MKLVFLSDFHLGFSQPEREEEAFENAMSAMKTALMEKPDLIVFTGDLFHEKIPSHETLLEAFKILSLPRLQKFGAATIEKETSEGRIAIDCPGIPVIAIHGTHEQREKNSTNALELLEGAGFIVYLHAEKACFERHREKIVFHGLGGVPELKARDALKQWNPLPEPGALNVLLLHQSFKEFLPFEDEMIATLSLSDLPKGFDLIVNGHLHWSNELQDNGIHLLMPGSTIITQMKNLESKKKKGFFVFETKGLKAKFVEIPGQREFFYKKISLNTANAEEAREAARDAISEILGEKKFQKMPLVKLKVGGSLAKGFSAEDIDFSIVEMSFLGKAIVSIDHSFKEESFSKKIKELSMLQQQKKSLGELGFEILEKNLKETEFENAFDARGVFELLEKGENEKALELIISSAREKKQ
ncbi:MAG: DNA repair exonuclease [Candidatus Diapherotrites archaeon]